MAGRSAGIDGSQDLLILKYSSIGELISEIRYISAPYSWDEANSIALDSFNNLYCIGSSTFGTTSSFAIIQKYSPKGSLLWFKNFNNNPGINSEGVKITVDNDNNVIAGYHLNGARFTKYTSVGDSLWTTVISDDSSNYKITDLISDISNNIYVAITQSYLGGSDFPFTLIHIYKYDKNGALNWHKIFNGIYTKKIILDKNKNLLLLINYDYSGRIIKIDKTGEIEWDKNNFTLILTDLNVDNDNNIIVTGYNANHNSFGYFTMKYSQDGSEIWTKKYNSPENLNDYAYASASAIDNLNNIIVTGSSLNSVNKAISNTIKYSDSGELLWQQKYDAPHSKFDSPNFLFVDDSNDIFIGGDVADSTNGWNFFLIKIKQNLATGLKQVYNNIPEKYSLKQNYPNPFNPETIISYELPTLSFVTLKIYDLLGKEIATLVNEEKPAGSYKVNFNANRLPSGVYFYTITAGSFHQTKKMVLLK